MTELDAFDPVRASDGPVYSGSLAASLAQGANSVGRFPPSGQDVSPNTLTSLHDQNR
jgi:hypothetical protein